MIDMEFCERELGALREELHGLKSCQVSFLTLAITATGVLLGLEAGSEAKQAMAYLVPLVILLPFWLIFFDKATTITRIVGYYRVIEKGMLHEDALKKLIGWENALAKYRCLRANRVLGVPADISRPHLLSCACRLILPVAGKSYWVFANLSFFGISILCLAMCLWTLLQSHEKSFTLLFDAETLFSVLWAIGLLGILIVSTINFRRVWQLTWGRYSYDVEERRWECLLDLEDDYLAGHIQEQWRIEFKKSHKCKDQGKLDQSTDTSKDEI
jgi:hypothetical protein